MADNLIDIKKNLKSKKLILGTEKTLKALQAGKVSKIFLSANTPESVVIDFNHYCDLTKTELIVLDIKNDELGIVCKKPFPISVIGLTN